MYEEVWSNPAMHVDAAYGFSGICLYLFPLADMGLESLAATRRAGHNCRS
jgi:hypothetical protein